MTSFWEQDAMLGADFCIVGGGILGLYTALELRKRYPKEKISILERDILPHGASSRNAGFACFGSMTEIYDMIETAGSKATLEIIENRYRGIQEIMQRWEPKTIGYESHGGYELIASYEDIEVKLERVNELLRPLFGKTVFRPEIDRIHQYGFKGVTTLLYNPYEGQLHSGLLLTALQSDCRQANIAYYSGANVSGWKYGTQGVHVMVGERIFHCQKLIYTTNAFVPAGIQGIKPGRGQVLVTSPIHGLPFRGCFHMESGYYYFRNIGNRILIGGGRNLDFKKEETSDFGTNTLITDHLEELLNRMIIPNKKYTIDYQWSGIMAFHSDHLPQIHAMSDQVWYAMNCNGMGVSLSPVTARKIVDFIS